MPTTLVSSPTAEELKAIASDLSAHEHRATVQDPTVQEFEGACWNRGPLLPVPHPIETNIPTEMAPVHVNISDSQQVYCCQAKGCPEGPSSSHAAICAYVCDTYLGMKLLCPFIPITFLNFDALKLHIKQPSVP